MCSYGSERVLKSLLLLIIWYSFSKFLSSFIEYDRMTVDVFSTQVSIGQILFKFGLM